MGQPILSNSERLSIQGNDQLCPGTPKTILAGLECKFEGLSEKKQKTKAGDHRGTHEILLCLAVCPFPPSRETG